MLVIKRRIANQKIYTYSGAAVLVILATTTAIRIFPDVGQFIANAPAKKGSPSIVSAKGASEHHQSTANSQASNPEADSQFLPSGPGLKASPRVSLSGQPGSSPSSAFVAPANQSVPSAPSGTTPAWPEPQPVTGGSSSSPSAASEPGAGSPQPTNTGTTSTPPLLQASLPLVNTNLSLL